MRQTIKVDVDVNPIYTFQIEDVYEVENKLIVVTKFEDGYTEGLYRDKTKHIAKSCIVNTSKNEALPVEYYALDKTTIRSNTFACQSQKQVIKKINDLNDIAELKDRLSGENKINPLQKEGSYSTARLYSPTTTSHNTKNESSPTIRSTNKM